MEDLDGTHSYEYDALYRLTEVTYPDEETDAYTYDPVGNRLTKDTDDYTYDAADQLTDLEGVEFDYDDNGNQTDRGNDTFEYDHENRLTESVIDSVTSTSVYSGDGLRMSHTVGQTTTSYTWDVASGLPVVLQDGTNTYVYGLDLISATDGSGDQTYFLYDGLGSVTDLTDDEADVVDDYTYDVFGAIRSQSGSSDNYWLFTGEQLDSDEELYYLRARYYDPETGRFLGRDPLPAGHPYGYGANNPVRHMDPSGLCHTELGGDALCFDVHRRTTRYDFRAEWEHVLVATRGSGEPHDDIDFQMEGRFTWHGPTGSVMTFSIDKEGSGAMVASATVRYAGGQSLQTTLRHYESAGGYWWAAASAPNTLGLPVGIDLKLAPSEAAPGTWMNPTRLSLDLQTGETSHNTCGPPLFGLWPAIIKCSD